MGRDDGQPGPAGDDGDDPLVDWAGVRHAPVSAAPRIVSLVPSLTELLFALGLEAAVVGRTAFCVHPRDRVRRVRSVGGTKSIDVGRILELAPTHVVVNVDETPRAVAAALTERGCSVVVTHPVAAEDNVRLYRLLGGIFRRTAEAEALATAFTAALARARRRAAGWPERRALYLIWKDPWMTVGRDTYISRLLEVVRWSTVPDVSEPRYPAVALDAELVEAVDLVLFASEPFPFKPRHLQAFRALFPAHADKALAIDGEMVSWYGSRAISALSYLETLAEGVAGGAPGGP